MARQPGARLLLVGEIVGAHGIGGAVRVRSFTEDPSSLTRLRPLLANGERPLQVNLRSARKEMLVVTVAGVGDRNAAEALAGTRLYVPREALPEPGEEEYYHADLIGLRVESRSGEAVGTVAALYDFGGGDIIEVRTGGGELVPLPFDRDVVPVVDIAGGRIVIDPPAGLMPDLPADGKR